MCPIIRPLNKLDAEIINTDRLHSLLYPQGAHTPNGDFTADSLKAVYECLRPIAYYLSVVAPEKHIIIEGSFRKKSQRDAVTSVLEENKQPYNIIFVTAGTDEQVKKRLEERLKTGHAGDFQHYIDIKKVFELPDKAYSIVNVGTEKELYDKIDAYIENLS